MKRMTDIRRKTGEPRTTPSIKPQPAIEMHRNGFFGRRVKKLSNLGPFKEKK